MDKAVFFESINQAAFKGQPFLFFVDYELSDGRLILDPERQTEVGWQIGGRGNVSALSLCYVQGSRFVPKPVNAGEYARKFRCISYALHRGDTFLANLTVKTALDTDFSLEEIFLRSRSPYRLLVPGEFVCFSPETFVRIEHGKIMCFPMKGTISGKIPDAENIILSDYKETCEHNTIVDFIRSDLARVGRNVRVERFRYIDRLETSHGDVLQVSSKVVADLSDGWRCSLGDIIRNLLPAGSICGAPRESTLRVIREAEGEPRGYYTGIIGYFDGENFDSAVMIRFIEQRSSADGKETELYFRSGGGITINSDCNAEYEEVLEKVYLPFGY
ncbi:MAG: aminodeoxychorismate synthase component I [Candidatus Aphodosoma sp.]